MKSTENDLRYNTQDSPLNNRAGDKARTSPIIFNDNAGTQLPEEYFGMTENARSSSLRGLSTPLRHSHLRSPTRRLSNDFPCSVYRPSTDEMAVPAMLFPTSDEKAPTRNSSKSSQLLFQSSSFRRGMLCFSIVACTQAQYLASLAMVEYGLPAGMRGLPMFMIPCIGSAISFFVLLFISGWKWNWDWRVGVDGLLWGGAVVLEMCCFGLMAQKTEPGAEDGFRALIFAMACRSLFSLVTPDSIVKRFLLASSFILGLTLMLNREPSKQTKAHPEIWIFTILFTLASFAPLRPSSDSQSFSHFMITLITGACIYPCDDFENLEHNPPIWWIIAAILAFAGRQIACSVLIGCEPRLHVRLAPQLLGVSLIYPIIWITNPITINSVATFLIILLLGATVSLHALLPKNKPNKRGSV